VPGFTRPFPVAPRRPRAPDDPIDATRLALRLQALQQALDDLPGQARRFARWRHRVAAGAQREETFAAAGAQYEESVAAGAQGEEAFVAAGARKGTVRGKIIRHWPLRPGRPPGWRRKHVHEVHEVLNNTHGLALWALAGRDTS
jgi:hypothetical protein